MQRYDLESGLKPLPIWLKLVSAAIFLGIMFWVIAINVGWIQK
ncbi:MAG: hypothetical protein AAB484_00065 [Patescibacteria group bacterium]